MVYNYRTDYDLYELLVNFSEGNKVKWKIVQVRYKSDAQ